MAQRRLAIPRRFKARGRWWRVRRSRRVERGIIGEADPDSCSIWLAPKLKGRDLDKTFIHEVLHACLPPTGLVPIEVEERIIDALEGPLTELILSGALVSVPEEVA